MYETRFKAMGCHMMAAVDSQKHEAQEALDLVPVWFQNWEGFLSRFRPDSELSRVNGSTGPAQVSDTFWQVLLAAQEAYEWSEGLVTPTVLPALEAAGYDRSFDELGQGPAATLVPSPGLDSIGAFEEVRLDPARRTVELPANMKLDFGGVAKGWAAQQAMSKLAPLGPALVDAGGDIAISAQPHDQAGWRIGVADPRGEGHLFVLEAARGGVATSGSDLRRWTRDGETQHHLIDPRSRRPSESDVLSATVIGPDLMRAEMASKTALLLGSENGLAWLEAQPTLAGLLITQDGEMQMTPNFEAYIVEDLCKI